MTEFQPGDVVIVTGDTAIAGHQFPTNTEVRVLAIEKNGSQENRYKCEYLDGSDYWWVAPEDMLKQVTEDELKAVMKSLGVNP